MGGSWLKMLEIRKNDLERGGEVEKKRETLKQVLCENTQVCEEKNLFLEGLLHQAWAENKEGRAEDHRT